MLENLKSSLSARRLVYIAAENCQYFEHIFARSCVEMDLVPSLTKIYPVPMVYVISTIGQFSLDVCLTFHGLQLCRETKGILGGLSAGLFSFRYNQTPLIILHLNQTRSFDRELLDRLFKYPVIISSELDCIITTKSPITHP